MSRDSLLSSTPAIVRKHARRLRTSDSARGRCRCPSPSFGGVNAVGCVTVAFETSSSTAAAAAATFPMAHTSHNYTVLVTEVSDDGYDSLVADIWVGVVLTLMVLSCVCCVCSCLLYHKFQQWKRSALQARAAAAEAAEGPTSDIESLPSYTIVSGLPTYEEALDQLRQARERRTSVKTGSMPEISTGSTQPVKLSVTEFFQLYKGYPPI